VPVTWRQNATDADNHLRLNLGAAFVQDQVEFTKWLQAIVGVRYDHFGLTYHNNRNGQELSRVDRLVSPRFGLVVKPVTAVSLYGSYSVSYLPSSGDQFSSLTAITQQVKPEKFTNYEGGLKWDIRPGLFLSSAVYRLNRTNTRATDPNDPTRIIQTGSQRTDGFEVGLSGNITRAWTMTGGYSWQNARITSATTAAVAGKQVGQVPHNNLSLWNKYNFTSKFAAGLGLIYRSDMFATVDNTVVVPGYLKADAAVYYTISEHWRLQANIENITNKRYFVNADSNTNISPGAPRSVKLGLTARF
jgi:catecholate siderophore receptor